MADSLTIVLIIGGVIFAIAMIIPIFFDVDFPQRNALCIIFGLGGNYTCDSSTSNVTFTGLNGIVIFPNGTNQIIWNFTNPIIVATSDNLTLTEGDQIDFESINSTHTEVELEECLDEEMLIFDSFLNEWICVTNLSLGGDADVFKNTTSTNINFRGISEGIGINVTEQTNDILVALKDCNDMELLVFNSTTGDYECISGADFSSQVGFDTDEVFYPWVGASSTGVHVILSMTNYDTRAVREIGTGTASSSLTWSWPVPSNFDNTSDIKFTLYWITQSANAGTVCHTLQTMPKVEGNDIDGTFGTSVKICTANQGSNILVVDEFTLTPTQHGFDPDDLGFISLHRDPTDPSDTLTTFAYILLGKIEWNI